MDKVGLFLCTGCEIDQSIKTDGIEELAKEHGAAFFLSHPCLCSTEGIQSINNAIENEQINGLCIAACSHREKTDAFKVDPYKASLERVSLREQVVWSHKPNDEDTQMLAEDLIKMSLARIAKNELATPNQEALDRTVLIVGGGLAGLQAAKAAAGMGHPVVLVEKQEQLGGYLNRVKHLVPESPPYDSIHPNHISKLAAEVEGNQKIKIFTGSKLKSIQGQPGQFEVTVSTSSSEESLKAGAIVQATGALPYDATKLAHLGYGKSPNVITSHELEDLLLKGGLKSPLPKRVVFIQCAGSRDENHLKYCSSECCATTLKQVSAIHSVHPDVECAVIYRDLRSPGQLEHFYLSVQEQAGSLFTRGEVENVEVEDGNKVRVQINNSLLGDRVTLEADLVVLATGMTPNSADGEAIRTLIDARARIARNESETQVRDAKKVEADLVHHEGTEILNLQYRQGPDMPVLHYAFPDSHYICFPYETRRTGIYAAGTVRAPMDPAQAAEDGWGAAMKAVQCVQANLRGQAVHPRAGDTSIANFFLQRCTQCKRCTEECPFGALNEDEKGTPEYFPMRCRKCGICLGACPERIISFPEFSVDGVASMIKALEVPDEDEEKPRMIALLCENDAIPALDQAAYQRIQWNPWIRVIPVRCLGSVNTVWIADSLSRGIDGIILIGCKSGDDYQCHYIQGSELAKTRMTNVKETLDRLSLEPERVQVHEVSHNEFYRIPELFEEFAETIEELGPNPYKGF